MGKLTVKNIYGGDLEIESKCGICGKEFTYRLKERKVCANDECYKESKKRRERNQNSKY